MSHLNRSAATALAPLFARAASRQLERTSRAALTRRRLPAIAVLVQQHPRFASTESSTHSNSSHGSFPPPGFNADQAQRPQNPPEKKRQSQEAAEAEKQSSAEHLIGPEGDNPVALGNVSVPTGEAKTKAADDAAKVEMSAGKEQKAKASTEKGVASAKKEEKKLTTWQKVKKEVAHYRDGTKLLGTEIKISFKLAMKMGAGYELTRREHRQLRRTVQDLGRLVPFSVFVIVPLGELFLPLALKIFPNLLPSTYEGQKSKDAKAASLRTARKDVSNFLRQTLRETGLPISAANAQTDEFQEFFRKVRTTGESPSTSDVIKVCKTFKDDLTLDNLSRPQLVAICKYMNLNTFGTDAMLRYNIRHRMRQIKRDDKAISYEGVESLSVPELQTACASRGLRTHGMSPGRLRDDLQTWLDLRLRYGVPSTLLVLSNAYVYASGKDTEFSSQLDALTSVLSSVPEELFHEIELEVSSAEGAATNKQRLEVLKEQQELIEDENRESEESQRSGRESVKDVDDIDEDAAKLKQKKAAEVQSKN